MTQRNVLLIEAGHQAFANLVAADIPSLSGSYDAAGAAAAAQAASQPLDSDLTAIAALSTTSFGRGHLTEADAAAGRTLIGLGTLATQSGTFSGTSSGTNTGDQTRASLGLATSDTPQFTGIEVGNASDTTLARVSAGVLSVEGSTILVSGGALGTPASGVATNLTGTAASLTAGAVTTNANLTGIVTSSGNATNVQGLFLPYRTGGTFYYAPNYSAGLNQTLTQSRLYAMPFFVPVTTTFDSIGVVTTGTASAQARLGIYSDTSGKPNALILDAGAIATATSGFKTIAISQSLSAGWYWLAAAMQGAGGTLWCAGAGQRTGPNPSQAPFTGESPGYAQDSITGALPSPWGATTTDVIRAPVVYVAPH